MHTPLTHTFSHIHSHIYTHSQPYTYSHIHTHIHNTNTQTSCFSFRYMSPWPSSSLYLSCHPAYSPTSSQETPAPSCRPPKATLPHRLPRSHTPSPFAPSSGPSQHTGKLTPLPLLNPISPVQPPSSSYNDPAFGQDPALHLVPRAENQRPHY